MCIAGNPPDIICITEVIPKAQCMPIAPSQLALPGYATFSNFEPGERNLGASGVRGICFFVASHIHATEVKFIGVFSEQLWLRVSLIGGDDLIVGGIYRSPTSDFQSTEHLCNLLSTVSGSNPSHLIIMGDFNFSTIDWSCSMSLSPPSDPCHKFLEVIQDSFLIQHVKKATRFRHGNNPHILDLVFTNEEGMISNMTHLPPLGNSDHEVLWFKLHCYTSPRRDPGDKLNLNKGNYEAMANKLSTIVWESMEAGSLEDHHRLLTNTLKGLMVENIPSLQLGRTRNIYMTREALTLRNKKSKLWRKYILTRDVGTYRRFVKVRNELRGLTRHLRRNFEKSLAISLRENVKPFWKYVNSRLKTKPGIGDLRRPDGVLSVTDQDKAEVLAQFFSSVFTVEDCSTIPCLTTPWEGPTLETVDLTPALVKSKLDQLKTSTAPGPDGIPSRVLRELAAAICVPICSLFTRSLTSGSIPEDWKLATVVPIFKGGDRQEPSNYRPVSLTSVLCKVLEGLVRDRLMEFLDDTGQLHSAQHGFLPGRSCATQLLTALEDWTQQLENGEAVDVAYLDFRKAFDAVPHKRLIRKLHGLGIRGALLKWIESFLTGRSLRVRMNGTLSNRIPVVSGVPQGSVLGPLLFVIFVNDLPDCVKGHIAMVADDAKMYGNPGHPRAPAANQMQVDLEALADWSASWLLPFNLKKCKVLHLGRGNPHLQYFLLDDPISEVPEERDLGVVIDEELKFRKQAAMAVSKANQILGVIRRSFELFDADTLPLLFKTLVRPHLEYGNIIWGPFNKEDQRLVERVQRRATRLVPDVRRLAYQDRLRKLQLPSLLYRRRRGDVIMIYMLMNGLLKMSKDDFFQPAPTASTRGHPMKVAKPRAVSRARRNHWSIRAINDWNSLPAHVVLAPTLNSFKNRLDEHWTSHKFDIPTLT